MKNELHRDKTIKLTRQRVKDFLGGLIKTMIRLD